MEVINYEDLISQKEAADLRGATRAAISELIKRKRLHVIEIGSKKFLSRKEVNSFEGQKGKPLNEIPENGSHNEKDD